MFQTRKAYGGPERLCSLPGGPLGAEPGAGPAEQPPSHLPGLRAFQPSVRTRPQPEDTQQAPRSPLSPDSELTMSRGIRAGSAHLCLFLSDLYNLFLGWLRVYLLRATVPLNALKPPAEHRGALVFSGHDQEQNRPSSSCQNTYPGSCPVLGTGDSSGSQTRVHRQQESHGK